MSLSNRVPTDDFIAIMQEVFSRGKDITFTPSGTSMLPMLDGRDDTVTLSPVSGRLRRYDVAFYRRPESGQPVLHRMVGFDKDGGYIFSGDGQYTYEYGITDDNVLAVMTAFTHHGKERRIDSLSYRIYIHFMMCKKRLRIFATRVYHTIFKRMQGVQHGSVQDIRSQR